MALAFLRKIPNKSLIPQSNLASSSLFSTNPFPDVPTAAYYDDAVNVAGRENDFETLCYLLNKRVRDHCFNTTNTFKFLSNAETSLSALHDGRLVRTLSRLDPGFPRKSAFDALVARLSRLGRVGDALSVVEVVAREGYGINTVTFHPVLRALTRKKEMDGAWRVVEMMEAFKVPPDVTAFNYLLTAYCFVGDLTSASRVMERIEGEGLDADARTYDALVLGACKAGKVEGAMAVLRRMEDDGVAVLYSTHAHVINALLRLGYYEQAVKFVMTYGGRDEGLDRENFGVLASKLINLKRFEEAKLVLGEMEKRGLEMGAKLRDFYHLNVYDVGKY